MTIINEPEIVERLSVLHDAYERALVSNDVSALKDFFWNSPLAIRFGPREQLYGNVEITAYRNTHHPAATNRRLHRRSILTLTPEIASIMSEYHQTIAGEAQLSRQSQIWAKMGENWKIVSAHVSNVPLPSK